MLDIRFIRENRELVAQNTKNKGYDVNIDELMQIDDDRRRLLARADELREKRNAISSQLKGGRPSDELIERATGLKNDLSVVESELRAAEQAFVTILKQVPNIAKSDVPVGATEDENIVSKVVGEPTTFDFTPRSHADIAIERGWLDKERAAKVTGSRFGYIKGDLVKLQFAIVQFVLDTLTDESLLERIARDAGLAVSSKAFVPVLPPLMIRTSMYDAMDRLEPSDDRYKLENDDLWLQGSAEHVLGSMHADEIIEATELPLRYIGYATSFRREAGTYGKDMEGIFRMHQFDKLEMESLSTGDTGSDEHLFLIAIQEYLLATLELPYRVIQKCTADIGKPNARGIDMETWLPGQANYRETHTADYMTDYQARRLKTRARKQDGELELVHTNDATAFALGRIMIAIIENGQDQDGAVAIPLALRPYFGGRTSL